MISKYRRQPFRLGKGGRCQGLKNKGKKKKKKKKKKREKKNKKPKTERVAGLLRTHKLRAAGIRSNNLIPRSRKYYYCCCFLQLKVPIGHW